MSEADVLEKFKWCQKRTMESPIGSPERIAWVQIVRETEAFIRRMTTAATVVIQEQK